MRFYFVLNILLCILLFFLSRAVKLQKTGSGQQARRKRAIFIDLEENHPGLWPNDVVVLKGQFRHTKSQMRFISTETACEGGRSPERSQKNCHPLVIKFDPRLRSVQFFYKGKIGTHLDVRISSTISHQIQPNLSYTLKIKVNEDSFTVMLNDEVLATVADRIGSESILKLRSYGGFFTEFFIERAEETCGMRPGLNDGTLRIVGGTNARAGEFPWQASIRFKRKNSFFNFQHVCGASIINSCWLVTAAHCTTIPLKGLEHFIVRVGDYYNKDGNNFSDIEDVQEFGIEEIISHPNFTLRPSPRNDIALIKLQSNSSTCVNFSDFVQPICLPRANEDFPSQSRCSISGWGARRLHDSSSSFASILQGASVKIQEHRTCQNSHGKDKTNSYRVANETVCAADRGVDACQGDSGGPMACQRYKNTMGPHVLWGITSWGDDCAHPEKAGVYTKVVDYLDWIEETMRN